MIDGRVIRGVDINAIAFQRSFARLKSDAIKQEVLETIRSLFALDVDRAPARLHLHPLKNKKVKSRLDPSKDVSVYTCHGTADDKLKVSFTWEDGVAWMRLVGEHDLIDKCP